MNEHQIRCFLLVAEEGSFSKAAHRCAVSQPAISKTIATLEGELGIRLFSRQGNRALVLTEAGRLYLAFFQNVAAQWESLRSSIGGAAPTASLQLAFPACLEGFSSPSILPLSGASQQFLPPEQVSQALVKRQVDFSFCLQDDVSQGKQYALTSVGQSEAVILFSGGHFSRFGKTLEPVDFASAAFYLVEGEPYRRMNLWLERACLPFGFMPRTVYLSDWAVVLEKVHAGQGSALCYDFCASGYKQLSTIGLGAFQGFSLAWQRQLSPKLCDEVLSAVKQQLK